MAPQHLMLTPGPLMLTPDAGTLTPDADTQTPDAGNYGVIADVDTLLNVENLHMNGEQQEITHLQDRNIFDEITKTEQR